MQRCIECYQGVAGHHHGHQEPQTPVARATADDWNCNRWQTKRPLPETPCMETKGTIYWTHNKQSALDMNHGVSRLSSTTWSVSPQNGDCSGSFRSMMGHSATLSATPCMCRGFCPLPAPAISRKGISHRRAEGHPNMSPFDSLKCGMQQAGSHDSMRGGRERATSSGEGRIRAQGCHLGIQAGAEGLQAAVLGLADGPEWACPHHPQLPALPGPA